MEKSKTIKRAKKRHAPPAASRVVMSESEFVKLGGGVVAYIKTMTSEEARAMFPAVEGLPGGINLYALHGADGTPIALTDSKQAAIGHALGDELEITSLH